MPYARIDENNRITEWSYDELQGFNIEFSNGSYIDDNCTNGLDEFIIENGIAIYSPLPEKQIARLKKKLSDTDYIVVKIAEGAAIPEEYADIIKQRQEWRDEINTLESAR